MDAEASRIAGLAFVIGLGGSLLLMPLAIAFGRKHRLVVRPRLFGSGRSNPPISYLGGVAIAMSSATAFLVLGAPRQAGLIVAGGLVLLLLGLIDDVKAGGISARLRFVIQLMLAVSVAWVGYEGSLAKALFQIFVLVAVTNAFNLLDNMDGVAGSTAVGIALGVGVIAAISGTSAIALLAFAVAGATLGFLRFNFKSASAYLGNSGSFSLGFTLAALTFETGANLGAGWDLVGFVAVLAVPTTDIFLVTISRFVHARPFLLGGTDHLSHRLAGLGLSTRKVAAAHFAASVIGSAAVVLALKTERPGILVLLIAVFAAAAVSLMRTRVYGTERVRPRRAITVVLVGGLLGSVLLAVAPVISAAAKLHMSRAHFTRGVEHLAAFEPEAAKKQFRIAGDFAGAAEKSLGGAFTYPARMLPVARSNINLARALAEAAEMLTPAAVAGVDALSSFPVDEQGRPSLGLTAGRIEHQGWAQAGEYFKKAATAVDGALTRVQREDGFALPPLANARDEFLTKGNDLLGAINGGSGLAEVIPLLSGAEGPTSWFLAIQNPVELRATGGFLGAFGILAAENGQIRLARLDSNLALPPLKNPVPLTPELATRYDRFASSSMWQNVNMTPDFPTAAAQIMSMWEAQTGEKVDGVIALDAAGLSHLLRIVGPVDTVELGRIDSDNLARLALNEAYIKFPEKAERADHLVAVGAEAWSRLLTGTYKDPTALKPLAEAIEQRHLMAWSPRKSDAFNRLGMIGELRPPQKDTDFLLVVGQNAAANKVDFYMHRQIKYRVELHPGGTSKAEVGVDLLNSTPESGLVPYITGPYLPEDAAGLNRSYTSIYVPRGNSVESSHLNGEPAFVESHREKGLSVYSAFIEALPGKSSALNMSMAEVKHAPGEYRLYVQKQPTLNADRFSLEVTLPEGVFVTGVTPGMIVEDRKVRWSGDLETDKGFVIQYGTSLRDRLTRLINSEEKAALSRSFFSG